MPSLYDISVPVLIKSLKTVLHLLKKGEEWAQENGNTTSELINWRIHETMLPVWAQVLLVVMQTQKAIEGLTGSNIKPVELKETPVDELYAIVHEALKELASIDSADKITVEESTMVPCRLGSGQCLLMAVDFVHLYTLPNVHFHVTTLYDILRMKGVPFGKIDFLGLYLGDVRRD